MEPRTPCARAPHAPATDRHRDRLRPRTGPIPPLDRRGTAARGTHLPCPAFPEETAP